MYIDKALKRQNKLKKLFYSTMIFLSIFLPMMVYLSNIRSKFIYLYLLILEILIFLSILNKINFYKLKFSCLNNKLKFKNGLFSKENILICDKIAIVHTNDTKEDMEIIIVTTMKFRNKSLKHISKTFLQRYPEVNHEYLKLKKLNSEDTYYFQIINRGALNKYILLEIIYKNCVKAVYTSSAIDNIKIARRQNEF